jgi:hypothetical protein
MSHEDSEPTVLWTDGKSEETLPIVMDDRLCFDTIFRAVRLSPKQIVLYDIWTVNGELVHNKISFTKRQEIIGTFLTEFHQPDLTALTTIADAPANALVRGYECYDDVPGSIGVFTDQPVVKQLPVQE